MKTIIFVKPAVWVASLLLFAAQQGKGEENLTPKKGAKADAQAILDRLNSERQSMYTEDGTLDPAEVEHVQRMVRIYELRSGFTEVGTSFQNGEKGTLTASAEAQTEAAQDGEVQQLRNEVVELRERLQDLREQSQIPVNNETINEAAGAKRPHYEWKGDHRYLRGRPFYP